ncbi:MAG: DUF2061 domain-containing protein [Candidatus Thiodiazotropha sp. (ex Ustalcina ferruginea)]|nr:DUF2061 domain-containing protein [Candidatus Thiodiazotropha sp. (ex Ustalcina ferruginea)]
MTNSPLVEKPVRSLVKALSWRVTGSIDTILLSWLFTGNLTIAAAIGLTEVMSKMVLYYLHERVWNRISLGRIPTDNVDTTDTADALVVRCTQTP